MITGTSSVWRSVSSMILSPPHLKKDKVAYELGVAEISVLICGQINNFPLIKGAVGAFQYCSANVFSTNVIKDERSCICLYQR